MAVCLVTGGAGFLGSHLVDALVARGDRVRVLDNLGTGKLANLAQSRSAIELFAGDLGNRELVYRASQGADYLFHFAGACVATSEASTPGKWANPQDLLNVLMAAREAGVRRLIYASCASVYGPAPRRPFQESDPLSPQSPHGFAKQTEETQCSGFSLLHGLETVRLRFFNVFGPRQSPASPHATMIPVILRTMLAEQNPVIFESPFEQQDYLSIADAVHATLLAAECRRVAGKVYNIARGRTASLVQVVAAVNQLLGANLQPFFCDPRPVAGWDCTANITRAEAELGFCPGSDLKQSLGQFIDHLRKHPEVDPPTSFAPSPTDSRKPHFYGLDTQSSLANVAEHSDASLSEGV